MHKPLVRVFQETKYRMAIRHALQKASIEEVKISYEESKRELERRQKEK